MSKAMSISSHGGGHLYMQTNEVCNAIVHYRWSKSGTLTEVERVPTGGAGSARTPSRARGVSSSQRINAVCLRQMAATIRFPASA